jgi:hypothetical protein
VRLLVKVSQRHGVRDQAIESGDGLDARGVAEAEPSGPDGAESLDYFTFLRASNENRIGHAGSFGVKDFDA